MNTMTPVPETPELPDDPRACCEMIIRVLDEVFDDFDRLRASDFARLTAAAARSEDDLDTLRDPLMRLAGAAETWADACDQAVTKARELARHGACRHRITDACHKAHDRYKAEGREKPDWLDWLNSAPIQREMDAAAAVGETISPDEAISRIEDRGEALPAPEGPFRDLLGALAGLPKARQAEATELLLGLQEAEPDEKAVADV